MIVADMEGSATTGTFDVSRVHKLLDQAEAEFHKLFEGRVPGHVDRFTPHLDTVRMIADLAAQEAPKEEAV